MLQNKRNPPPTYNKNQSSALSLLTAYPQHQHCQTSAVQLHDLTMVEKMAPAAPKILQKV